MNLCTGFGSEFGLRIATLYQQWQESNLLGDQRPTLACGFHRGDHGGASLGASARVGEPVGWQAGFLQGGFRPPWLHDAGWTEIINRT